MVLLEPQLIFKRPRKYDIFSIYLTKNYWCTRGKVVNKDILENMKCVLHMEKSLEDLLKFI